MVDGEVMRDDGEVIREESDDGEVMRDDGAKRMMVR